MHLKSFCFDIFDVLTDWVRGLLAVSLLQIVVEGLCVLLEECECERSENWGEKIAEMGESELLT